MKKILLFSFLYIGSIISILAQVTHIKGPDGSGAFGQSIVCFANGNFAVSDPLYDENGKKDIGAVFIYDGKTHEVIASLKGKFNNDRIGNNLILLNDEKLFVFSPFWNNGIGALTLLTNKINNPNIVDESNSLVGTQMDDLLSVQVQIFPDKGYAISIASWNNNRGAVLTKNLQDSLTGFISKETAFTGTYTGDRIGQAVLFLNENRIVIASSSFHDNRGFVTVLDFSACKGEVTHSNSLVGEQPGDQVGIRIAPLKNNTNFIVNSFKWRNQKGAVTYMNAQNPVKGHINESNSLIGSKDNDSVGTNGVYVLNNNNYVVVSSLWDQHKGAVTWGDGSKGANGFINPKNSLVGLQPGDRIGSNFIELANGHFVTSSPQWNNGIGAVTWGNGEDGTVGEIGENNSLTGTAVNDFLGSRIEPLPNGDYVIICTNLNPIRGSVTVGNGSKGITGKITLQNSLIVPLTSTLNGFTIVKLMNGNFVVSAPGWNNFRGAVTFMAAGEPVTGSISEQNSLVGSNEFDKIGEGGIILLTNGNYVFSSPAWSNNRGAITWGNGKGGSTGVISDKNSMLGISTLGIPQSPGLYALSNGNYIAHTYPFNEGNGQVVWGNGATGTFGEINASNSLTGENIRIQSVTPLNNGNFVINSFHKLGEYNALTWGNGQTPLTGKISDENSLIGLYDGYGFANSNSPVIQLKTGDYIIYNRFAHKGKGLVTWADGTKGMTGLPNDKNSILGISLEDGINMIPVYNFPLKYLLAGRPGQKMVSILNFEVITSTEELQAISDKITIYPNPTSEYAYLKVNHNKAEEVFIKVLDQKGYTISFHNGTISENGELQLNIQNLAGGMYIVEISGSDFVERKKLVKN